MVGVPRLEHTATKGPPFPWHEFADRRLCLATAVQRDALSRDGGLWMWWFSGVAIGSGLAFLWYGVACLRSPAMVREFERFGIGSLRSLIGALEIAGGAGLLVGLAIPPLLMAAAFGLSLLMLLVVIARVRLRDSASLTLPAFVFSLVNGYLAFEAWHRLTG